MFAFLTPKPKQPTQITDANIRELVEKYTTDKASLPPDLREIPMGKWDVSRVTNMNKLFFDLADFNEPLNEWNVSNVTDMEMMFAGCETFNQSLNTWNVNDVTDMAEMFANCEKFNQSLNTWNVSNVGDMGSMFFGCTMFNQPLNEWGLKVGNVTNMAFMFYNCKNFNQPLNAWGDNVRNVTDMSYMFANCENFNQPLDQWNVGHVTNMEVMFSNCTHFNQNLSGWNVANVIMMDFVFDSCRIEEANKPRFQAPLPEEFETQLPRGVDPYQIHKATSKINYDTLNQFFSKNNPTKFERPSDYGKYIQDTLTAFIDESKESEEPEELTKVALRQWLRDLMDQRLNSLRFGDQSPQFMTTMVNALEYVKRQPAEFKQGYVSTFIHDCVNAYSYANANVGENMSCAAGALERLITVLATAALMTDPEKEEYQELIAIIEADPAKLVSDYIKDWYKMHKKGTEGAFPPEMTEATKKANLRDFLLSKFPNEATLIDAKIAEIADNIGYDEDDFDVRYGGRRRRRTKKRKVATKKRKVATKKRKVATKKRRTTTKKK